jgi:hypothetical protein
MELQQLRFGNYIQEHGSPFFTKLDFSTLESIHYRRNMMYREIPLTEELIVRLGFKLTELKNYTLDDYILAEVIEAEWFFVHDEFHYDLNNVRPIKYVSDLQNVFYFLSGKELTLESLKQ